MELPGEIFLLKSNDGRFQTRKKVQLITYTSTKEKMTKRVIRKAW